MLLPGNIPLDIEDLKESLGMNTGSNAITKIGYGSYKGDNATTKNIYVGFTLIFILISGTHTTGPGTILWCFPTLGSNLGHAIISDNGLVGTGLSNVSADSTSVTLGAYIPGAVNAVNYTYCWIAFG